MARAPSAGSGDAVRVSCVSRAAKEASRWEDVWCAGNDRARLGATVAVGRRRRTLSGREGLFKR